MGATHIAADRKQLRLERHTYKRHGSPWRAAPESDIAYATAGPYPSRNPPAMAGYERTGRPHVATTRSVGGRVWGGGPLWALQGGGRAAEARAAAAAAGGQRASSERDRTSIPGGGAEANSRQGRARHDNGNDGEAGTTKGHGGLIRPRPRGAQDEYSAVTTRHARVLCSRVLKTRTRVASTVG